MILLISFVVLILNSKTVYTINYSLHNTEQRALKGDFEAMNLAFNHYLFYVHEYDKAESLFRKLVNKGYSHAKAYLGMVLTLTPQKKDKYLEGIVCLKEAMKNSKWAERDIKTIFDNPKYSYNITDLSKYKCNLRR